MSDLRQSKNWAGYLQKIGWKTQKAGHNFVYLKKLPFLGWVAKIQRPQGKIPYKEIDNLAKKLGVAVVYFEPQTIRQANRLKIIGYKLTRSPFLPTKTLWLKLTETEGELLNQLKKDARAALQKTETLKTEKMQNPKQIERFWDTWKNIVGWGKYVPPLTHLQSLRVAFGKNCLLLECFKTLKQPLAGAVFVIANGAAYYLYAFTSGEGRKALAQYRLVWEGILWAKKKGAEIFDFEGIYDERFPKKSWLGFSHFKKSFGGQEVAFPGCFVKYYSFLAKILRP